MLPTLKNNDAFRAHLDAQLKGAQAAYDAIDALHELLWDAQDYVTLQSEGLHLARKAVSRTVHELDMALHVAWDVA